MFYATLADYSILGRSSDNEIARVVTWCVSVESHDARPGHSTRHVSATRMAASYILTPNFHRDDEGAVGWYGAAEGHCNSTPADQQFGDLAAQLIISRPGFLLITYSNDRQYGAMSRSAYFT